jgi:hypothetical protein
MFTVKFFRGKVLCRISQADAITFEELQPENYRVVVIHRSDRTLEQYYVGGLPSGPIANIFLFDRAIIENSAGQTTEVVRPLVALAGHHQIRETQHGAAD